MKQTVKMSVDFLMLLLLNLLMAYSLVGEEAHEYIGISMFSLFLIHHFLNRAWWKKSFKGRYTAKRVLGTAVNLLLTVVMIMLPISGMMMSRYLFSYHPLGSAFDARIYHLLASHWGFVLMSFHLGMHWNSIWAQIKRKMEINERYKVLWRGACLFCAAYGAYALIKRQFVSYLFLQNQFVFFDFQEPIFFFFMDMIAIMMLCGSIGFVCERLCTRLSVRKHKHICG